MTCAETKKYRMIPAPRHTIENTFTEACLPKRALP